MDPLPGTARVPNGFGCTGPPRSQLCPRSGTCIVCTFRDGWAGFLTPWGTSIGLDGPMPRSITLVLRGRCRPSPDRVPESASPDRDAGGIATGHLSSGVQDQGDGVPDLRVPMSNTSSCKPHQKCASSSLLTNGPSEMQGDRSAALLLVAEELHG